MSFHNEVTSQLLVPESFYRYGTSFTEVYRGACKVRVRSTKKLTLLRVRTQFLFGDLPNFHFTGHIQKLCLAVEIKSLCWEKSHYIRGK